MAYPTTLTSLSPREAITDTIYRVLIGFDRNDIKVFNSAFAGEDVTVEFRDGESRVINGLSNIRAQLFAHVGPMDTTHTTSNVRVDVQDGANTAHVTCNALAQHCPPGRGKESDGPKYLVGGEYSIDLAKDDRDGLWKINKWVTEVIWKQGDASVMQRLG